MGVVWQMFVIVGAATVAGEVFARLRQPPIVGELLAGILLGPHVAGVIHTGRVAQALASLGVVVLLFTAGLESPLSELLEVGTTAVVASVAGMIAAAGTGIGIILALGHGISEALAGGLALSASSVGVAARVFADLGIVSSRAARIVMGAAVIDDVVVLALLPVLLHRSGSSWRIATTVALAIGSIAGVALLGTIAVKRHGGALFRARAIRTPFAAALTICLGLAALAERVGLAALVGAFLAGMVLAGTKERLDLDAKMRPLYDFLVPFFFVITGAMMAPKRIASGGVVAVLAVCTVTVAAKLFGGAAGARGLPWRERLVVGAGLIPRIEVPLIVATAALGRRLVSEQTFSIVVAASIVTTIVTPPLLKRLAGPRPPG